MLCVTPIAQRLYSAVSCAQQYQEQVVRKTIRVPGQEGVDQFLEKSSTTNTQWNTLLSNTDVESSVPVYAMYFIHDASCIKKRRSHALTTIDYNLYEWRKKEGKCMYRVVLDLALTVTHEK